MNHTKTWQHCPRCDYTEIEGTYSVQDDGGRWFTLGVIVGSVAVVLGNLLVTLASWGGGS